MTNFISNVIVVLTLLTMCLIVYLVSTVGLENQNKKQSKCYSKDLVYVNIKGQEFCAEGVNNGD